MVTFNINVNTELLRSKSSALKTIGDDVAQDVTSILNYVNNVSTGWTGANSEAYVTAFSEFKPKMDNNVEKIRSMAAKLDKAIVIIEQAQADIKSKSAGLPQ